MEGALGEHTPEEFGVFAASEIEKRVEPVLFVLRERCRADGEIGGAEAIGIDMEEPAAGNPGRWRHGEMRLDRARGKIPAAVFQRSDECFEPIPFRHLVVIDEYERIRIER